MQQGQYIKYCIKVNILNLNIYVKITEILHYMSRANVTPPPRIMQIL